MTVISEPGNLPVDTSPSPAISDTAPAPSIHDTRPVTAVAKGGQLGEELFTDQAIHSSCGGCLAASALGLVAVLLPAILALYKFWQAYMANGYLAARNWSLPWILTTLLAAILVTWLGLRRLFFRRWYLALHQYGIKFRQGLGSMRALKLEQISGIAVEAYDEKFFGLTWRKVYRVRLIPFYGKPVLLRRPFRSLPDFSDRFKKLFYPLLTPVLCNRLESGSWVGFGALAIHRDGLRIGQIVYPWQDIKSLQPDKGFLLIDFNFRENKPQSKGKTRRIAIAKINNLEIFLELAQVKIKL
jgi:hypothetical protein